MASIRFVPFEKLHNTKAWKLTSEHVRMKSRGFCYTCGVKYPKEKLVAGHLIEKRGHASIYFDLRGLRAQCQWNCNRMAHGRKDIFYRKLLKEIGQKELDDLYGKSQKSKKWTEEELEEIERTFE